MFNILLSKKVIIVTTIFLGGLLISLGVLISANLVSAQSGNSAQVTQWTEPAGLGISAPACASSSADSTTCVNNKAQAALSWTWGGLHDTCYGATITVTGVGTFNNQPCTGSRTFNNLANNKSYPYTITWSWESFGGNDGDGFLYLYGQDVSSGSFTTPNCAVSTNTTLNVGSRTASNVSIVRISGPSNIGGTTDYTRTYSNSISAVLRAPATAGSTDFSSWLGCDSVGGSGNRECTVNINSGGTQTVTADYDSGPPTTPVLESVTTSCSANNPRNTISWSVSESASITDYHIQRCSGSGCTNFSQIATDSASPYVDSAVTSGTLYRYRLRSHNHNTSLFSSYSNIRARTTTSCPMAAPDLTAGASSPSSATVGTAVTLSAPVSNIGTASTGAGFTNLFQRATSAGGANATDIGTHVRGSALGAGNSINATLSYAFPSVRTYHVRVCADKSSATNTGTITETNENNNCGPWTTITSCVSNQGSSCTSAPNSCGQTNTGTYQCDGSCSAVPPPPSSCNGGGSSLSCSRSPSGSITVPAQVQFIAVRQGGANPPYTFKNALGTVLQTGSSLTFTKTFTSADTYPYAVEVSASNAAGPYACGTPVTVGSSCSAVSASITAAPDRVASGATSNIAWNASGVTGSCVISGTDGYSNTVPGSACTIPDGNVNRSINVQTTYCITCNGASTPQECVTINMLPGFEEF